MLLNEQPVAGGSDPEVPSQKHSPTWGRKTMSLEGATQKYPVNSSRWRSYLTKGLVPEFLSCIGLGKLGASFSLQGGGVAHTISGPSRPAPFTVPCVSHSSRDCAVEG